MSDILKFFLILVIFLLVIPSGTIAARSNPKIRFICFAFMIFFTSWSFMLHVYPAPDWRGTSRGFALSLVDILSCIVLFSMLFDSKCKVSLCPPGVWLYWIYFALTLLSGFGAVHLAPWGFEVVKMFWMYVFFLAVYNYLRNTKELWPLFYAICGTLIFMLLYGMYQKYIIGTFQIPSTLPHQNSLSLYVSLFGCLILGTMLNEKSNIFQTLLLAAGFISTTLLIIFSYSRGGMACYFLGLTFIGIMSVLFSKMTPKKATLAIAGILLISMFTIYALPRIIYRFKYAPEKSALTRVNLNKAAVRLANQFKLGVGANNFCEYSGPFKPYAREQHENLKTDDETSPYGGIVETIYLLVAAECGWLGLVSLLAWFWYYLIQGLILCVQLRNRVCCGVIIGACGGLTANYIQSLMEWSLKQYGNFYQIMLIFALIAVLVVEKPFILAQKKD